MKARYIKKLRKRIKNFKKYDISVSSNLFGEPFAYYCSVMSDSSINALYRFWHWYFRKFKMKFKYSGYDTETTYNWGKVKVTNEKGFSYFYR